VENGKASLVVTDFQSTSGLSSWYIDHTDGSFTAIDQEGKLMINQNEVVYDESGRVSEFKEEL